MPQDPRMTLRDIYARDTLADSVQLPASAYEMPKKGDDSQAAALVADAVASLGQAYQAWNSARMARYRAASESLNAQHQSFLDDLSARYAEGQAQDILEAGLDEESRLLLESGQLQASTIATQRARGLSGASARETLVGQELAARIDARSLRETRARQAANARLEATSLRGESLLGRVSARNLRQSRATEAEAAAGALLGGFARTTRLAAELEARR